MRSSWFVSLTLGVIWLGYTARLISVALPLLGVASLAELERGIYAAVPIDVVMRTAFPLRHAQRC